MAKRHIYGWRVTDEGDSVAVFKDRESAETAAGVLEDTYDTGGFCVVPVYRPVNTTSLGTFKRQNPDLIWW